MTDTMKERIARTFAKSVMGSEKFWESFILEAEAVLASMLLNEDGTDCSEQIRIAGEEAYYENGDARAIFNAMLNAAISEGKE